MDSVEGIDPARPGRHIHRRHAARKASIAFGRHGRCLLMVAADILQTFSAAERVVEVHGAAAGQHEDMTNAMLGYAASDIVRQSHAGFSHRRFLPQFKFACSCHLAHIRKRSRFWPSRCLAHDRGLDRQAPDRKESVHQRFAHLGAHWR